MKLRFVLLAYILAFGGSFASAAQVLVREIPADAASESFVSSGAATASNFGERDQHWDAGLQSATDGEFSYFVGETRIVGSSSPDGYLMKIDPIGTIIWRRNMNQIFTEANVPNQRFFAHDITFIDRYLYVVGQDAFDASRGFIAKINRDGQLLDYTLFVAATTPTNQAKVSVVHSVAANFVNGQPTIVIGGSMTGSSMWVNERQKVAPQNDVLPGLVFRLDSFGNRTQVEEDAYVIRLDANLRVTFGTTLGFAATKDWATAVAIDPEGVIYSALKFENPDNNPDNNYIEMTRDRVSITRRIDGSLGLTALNHPARNVDWNGFQSWGMVVKLDPRAQDVNPTSPTILSGFFVPVEMKDISAVWAVNGKSDSRIVDLAYQGGSLFVAGEWRGRLNSEWKQTGFSYEDNSAVRPITENFDLFVARLDSESMAPRNWAFLQSSDPDYFSSMQVTSSGVYLSGVAGGPLVTSNLQQSALVLDPREEGKFNFASSRQHVFWASLSPDDLSLSWLITPEERGSMTVPGFMRAGGISPLDDTAVLKSFYKEGSITFGEPENARTLPDPGNTNQFGFYGILDQNTGDWKEQFTVTINTPVGKAEARPHEGDDFVLQGTVVEASVPPIIYIDDAGNEMESPTATEIRDNAVTRHINIGYTFENSEVNGTTNQVSFTPQGNTTLTFLWRTEHAIEIDSDIIGIEGLTSTAAGNPEPEVQKHWVAEGEPFTAFIDGAATLSTEPGRRWLSTGFVATGAIAEAAGVSDESFVPWDSFQERQQTAKVTVGGPGTILWRWQPQISVRVATNIAAASGGPITSGQSGGDVVDYGGTGEFWFEAGAEITASSESEIETGVSNLTLRGYENGIGSISPQEGSESSFGFTLNEPTSFFWDYGPTIFDETVTIGNAVTFNTVVGASDTNIRRAEAPEVGEVITGPTGSSWNDMLVWDDVADLLYPLRPGVFTAEFTNNAAPDDPARNIIVRVTAEWPGSADYEHVLETPPVDLDSSLTDGRAFVSFAYSEGRASINESNGFTTEEPGRSVLVFSERGSGAATGNLNVETLDVSVVNSFNWETQTGSNLTNVTIGERVTDDGHDLEAVGHNGFVLTDLAPVNANVYNRETKAGPILPVNTRYPDAGRWLDTPADLAVAWYRVQDGIRWPFKAVNYDPQWSTSRRIVIASQLGSEGLEEGQAGFGANAAFVDGPFPAVTDSWRRPAAGSLPASTGDVRYVAYFKGWGGANNVLTADFDGWSGAVFVYGPQFDPARPSDNLVTSFAVNGSTPISKTILEAGWYHVVVSQDQPMSPVGQMNLDMSLGSNRIFTQPFFSGSAMAEAEIYRQPDPGAMGYNPNEEHALIAPSFIEASRSAAFALRNDLNYTSPDASFTSEPYVLVQVMDRSDPANPTPRMLVYDVDQINNNTRDRRFFVPSDLHFFRYPAVAGQLLPPPYPLGVVLGGQPMPEETRGENMDNRISYYEDRDNIPWVVSGGIDGNPDINAGWFYPLRADFWHPTAVLGEAVSFGQALADEEYNIAYDTRWPEDVAVLKAGETLTFAGGEFATDNRNDSPPPEGLPQAASWQAGKLVFDDANPSLNSLTVATQYLGRVVPVLENREVDLALSDVPEALTPASGDVTVEGLLWLFDALPASLKSRVYFNTSSQKLGVRGLLNGRVLGDGDLLATPGAQTILEPNVLSPSDLALLDGLSSENAWKTAVDALYELARDPNETGFNANMIGLDLDPETSLLRPAPAYGPGLAVITNPGLLDPGTSGTMPDGYITIAENDDPELTSPVAMHVVKVAREKYRGSIAVLEPDNVFDEKLSLRHTADFGGNVDDVYFEWYLREEDGRVLNPPGELNPTANVAAAADWTLISAGRGLSEFQLQGLGPTIIRDNLVFARYGFSNNNDAPSEFSNWAGAANSREPDLESSTVTEDIAYVPQLAPGWVKRVAAAVNAFDARFDDFRNESVPATYTSMLQQAGQRQEGPVAFNPDKDAVENVGLIELYETVLSRAEDFTIANASGTSGVNVALLNAANRIAALYQLLGDEAYSDALDPTIGFSTVGGEFGNLAPTIHSFENMVPSLLEEELALLRGRGEVGARPAYNRLLWNFANGPGEAAYVMNYGITDMDENGFINEDDARRLYPQGHGDAWGHYTMALRGYYRLAQIGNFTWEPRSELYNIDGVVVDVDYLDERAFARTAAARARTGAHLVDLTYRQAYTDDPSGQWQGYTDLNADRAWGVQETAQRTASGAFFDWMMANAVLPGEETDASKTGIRKVDRTTVGELRAIAAQGQLIQSTLDMADQGLNPAGLDPNVVPFDIDPVLTRRDHDDPATHFEQVYERAVKAAQNALRTFDYANEIALQLRQTEETSEALRQSAIDQDLAFRNDLIEIFGTPHEGNIGAGKAYPAGYNGPDLYLYLYVDQTAAGGDVLPPLPESFESTTIPAGLNGLATDTNPLNDNDASIDAALRDTAALYFANDLNFPVEPATEITLNLPRGAEGYALVAPSEWGSRRSPGEIQLAIQELVQAQWQLRMATAYYEAQGGTFERMLNRFELMSGLAAESLQVLRTTNDGIRTELSVASDSFTAATVIGSAAAGAFNYGEALAEAFPKSVGLATDTTSPARSAAKLIAQAIETTANIIVGGAQIAEYQARVDIERAQLDLEERNLTLDRKAELVDLLFEIDNYVYEEADLQMGIIEALEAMRLASMRVATVIERGQALVEERLVFNQRVAATTTRQRYEDFTFRVFQNDALRKYQSSFDLAAQYAYLAGKAYQYELNLPDNHAANASPLLASFLRERTLGEWADGQPIIGSQGLAEGLAILQTNYETLQSQLGFNNPTDGIYQFSLRRELERVGMSSRVNGDWRTALENYRVPDLWNYEFEHNGLNYGYVFRQFCRPFAPEAAGAQPALVIPFSTTVEAGRNWFGEPLAGGDSSFNASNFATKIRASGVRFDGYNNTTLSQTPQVYLIPVGADRMYMSQDTALQARTWNVVDRHIPAPLAISSANLSDPDWRPFSGSTSGFFGDLRKFSSFRAFHDAGGWTDEEMLNFGRHVGRSVWNTQWVLIIPSATLLFEGNNDAAGLDTLIYGAPLAPATQADATVNDRDGLGIRDITILLDTYSISGN